MLGWHAHYMAGSKSLSTFVSLPRQYLGADLYLPLAVIIDTANWLPVLFEEI